ncbi:MAG: precorrin-3B C(17)-methyltransferase [Clostridiaceae bacterium]|nr:precorrin-3B C(17)-methyltransferase [Clostridiaceae bacterium]
MNQLFVVGIGPGDYLKMTQEAVRILEACDTIVGYTVYVDLIREYFPGREYIVTGMRREEERCRMALESAASGKRTAVVCSGDAGVYGMAGLLLELGQAFPAVEITVAAGVTAALSGGAVLGAPLGHDFAVISLSDLLTPWEQIARRLQAAAQADFCICLYNPSSRKRQDYLKRACEILMQYRKPDTVCGYVRSIGREGESSTLLPLSGLAEAAVDMFTTVFIGNSQTERIGGYMVTPRGYPLHDQGGEVVLSGGEDRCKWRKE